MLRLPRKKRRLSRYVASMALIWAVVLAIALLVGGPARFHLPATVCGGFFLGMLAIYLLVHVHVWD